VVPRDALFYTLAEKKKKRISSFLGFFSFQKWSEEHRLETFNQTYLRPSCNIPFQHAFTAHCIAFLKSKSLD